MASKSGPVDGRRKRQPAKGKILERGEYEKQVNCISEI